MHVVDQVFIISCQSGPRSGLVVLDNDPGLEVRYER